MNSNRAMLATLKALSDATDGAMPLHQAVVLAAVAAANKDGIEMREIASQAGISTSSVSRNIAALGDWHRMQKPGLGLVETRMDYQDRRRKPVHLSSKGEAVWAAFLAKHEEFFK